MVLLVVASIVLILLLLLLFTPLTVQVDTRIPGLTLEWMWIFRWSWRPGNETLAPVKQKTRNVRKQQDKRRPRKKTVEWIVGKSIKSIHTIRSFRLQKMEIAFDTGDPAQTVKLYAFNYYPYPPGRHVNVNFTGENYVFLRITNRPWRILVAWFR